MKQTNNFFQKTFIEVNNSQIMFTVVCNKKYLIYKHIVSITIVQSYTRKYHKFVAVCIATSVQHE